MKVRVTLKDPDTMPDAVDEAAKALPKPEGVTPAEWTAICDDRAQVAKDVIAERWMEYSEYLVVEFDTDAKTATVVPNE